MKDLYTNISAEEQPWNRKTAPDALKQIVEKEIIKPCKTLEVGCGLGNTCIYLAEKGFSVSGLDISSSAIQYAQEKARQLKLPIHFFQQDFLKPKHAVMPTYDFIFDWLVLHHIYPEQREPYLKHLKQLLKPEAIYLSCSFSEKDKAFGGQGKFRKTPIGTTLYFSGEDEMRELFERHFKILNLKSIEVDGHPEKHCAVFAYMSTA